MPGDERYSEGHAKCRESLICMINKKLSKNIAIAIAITVFGIPSVFILYGMAAEKVQNDKLSEVDKQIQVHSVKQDTILFNQKRFRHNLERIETQHSVEMEKLHDKMEDDKKDIIQEMRRLHKK